MSDEVYRVRIDHGGRMTPEEQLAAMNAMTQRFLLGEEDLAEPLPAGHKIPVDSRTIDGEIVEE